ncbi:MAG: CBS domain-containing protein [Schleiferiaceae bacterium]|nr:CBS domain-containing protein [Schleiferiaceae bacterium]
MVKNYRGKRPEPKVQPLEHRSVAQCMSKKLITFKPEDDLEEVTKWLIAKRISGAPVIDDQEKLVGMISEGDCLKEVVSGKYNNAPGAYGKVGDRMTTEVYTLSPDTTVLEAAQAFLKRRFRRFPVVGNGFLLGQVSQSDILRAAYDLPSTNWH